VVHPASSVRQPQVYRPRQDAAQLIHQSRYSEVVGDLVQSAQQRRRHGNAKARPPEPRFVAAFAGHPDAVHAGHALAAAEIAHQRIRSATVAASASGKPTAASAC
jgi:hypothetical protein